MLGCAYEQYDQDSLKPTTPQTEYRLRQLGWTRDEFEGRTVLDVGCNLGALSVLAAQLGASSIVSIDPNREFVDDFTKVVTKHPHLNVHVSCRTLSDLDPNVDAADIVLFMEVLHWAVAQGASIPSIVRNLWELTREVLFIEFPWSIDEPSIRSQTQLTQDIYSADFVFEELDRAFHDVKVVAFMKYFGLTGPAKRVLVRASRPRPEYILYERMPQMCSIGRLGERSSNYFMPLLTTKGMKLFKQVSRHSCLSQLPLDLANSFLRDIVATNPTCLVVPEELDGQYVMERAGARYMLLPYVQRRRISFTAFSPVPLDHVLESIVQLRRDLRPLSGQSRPELVELAIRQRQHALPVPPVLKTFLADGGWLKQLDALLELGSAAFPQAQEICHGDLQIGNIVIDVDGKSRVVDLDTLTFGTRFTDALCALAWAGASEDNFKMIIDTLEQEEGIACTDEDFGIALLTLVQWFKAIEKQVVEDVSRTTAVAKRGLISLLAAQSSLDLNRRAG
jgi:2-polyprenyl-3-methyl-5-hydroxy-6-metoxy-1,4-benzoquinol methylase